MTDKRTRLTVLIVENRQTIATILSELLAGAGYSTRVVSTISEARAVLAEFQRGTLLVDMGMVRPDQEQPWQQLLAAAESCNLPVLTFSCSALPEGAGDVMVLRSPGDFAAVVDRVQLEWLRQRPLLGATMVGMGLLNAEELDAALTAQREFRQVGRNYPLGELLVRLGIISPEDLERALQKQEQQGL
jgi:CheY-like chemotaxis protein